MAPRYMVDSIDSGNFNPRTVVLPNGQTVQISLTAGYANGTYHASSQADGPTDVQIDVRGDTPGADVADIENGDILPTQAAQWVMDHNAHGGTTYPGILYCNRDTITTVANVLQAAGLQVVKDYRWWIATLDGETTVPDMTGVTAIQAYPANDFAGRNIDLSVVYDDAWKPTTNSMNEDDDMIFTPLTVDAGKGRAFASFEVGTNSQWVTNAYVCGKALWGAVNGVRVTVTDDRGNAIVLSANEDFPVNVRRDWAIPSGSSDVTLEWDPAKADPGAEFTGYVIGK